MNKTFLINILFLISIAFSHSSEKKELDLLDNKRTINISIPINLSEKDKNNYITILNERLKFITKKKNIFKFIGNELVFYLDSMAFHDDEYALLKSIITKNIYVEFREILNNIPEEKYTVSYVVFENLIDKKEMFLTKNLKIVFSYEDFSKIEIIPPSNKRNYAAKMGYVSFTIKKDNAFLKIFMEDLFKKYDPGSGRVFSSCSGVLSTAPIIYAPLEYEFSIPFHEGKEFKNRLVEMQIRYPLPFEILNY